MIPLFINVFVA